ncbi:hypothetical protein K457DRAFT_20715 [Linnemannia elongata AG-77]|uniref:Uncharacterized protein n=1 Tax=Linnemannia elongata AG-77 TaxID=1314771 RepID=A0A197JRX6_9FUNG|nr:hypothetical protein K457DRAFT_20715 [Linnemannia elongata AG-77]
MDMASSVDLFTIAALSTDNVSRVIPGFYNDAASTFLIFAGLGLTAPERLSLGHWSSKLLSDDVK